MADTRAHNPVLSWSGGKDSALALWQLLEGGQSVYGLLTTVTENYGRISMHGVRESLLDLQAAAVGLPLTKVLIPSPCPDEVYRQRMGRTVRHLLAQGVKAFAFGDLFLADVRAYREAQLAAEGAEAIFPLWGRDTHRLAQDFIDAGFRAVVVTVDPRKISRSFAGREYDQALLSDLPEDVDPCGENGEFHTFVYDGPPFAHPLEIRRGEVVERDGFIFADLIDRSQAEA